MHLDPGSEPRHELERANCSLRLGREADSLELRLMHLGSGLGLGGLPGGSLGMGLALESTPTGSRVYVWDTGHATAAIGYEGHRVRAHTSREMWWLMVDTVVHMVNMVLTWSAFSAVATGSASGSSEYLHSSSSLGRGKETVEVYDKRESGSPIGIRGPLAVSPTVAVASDIDCDSTH